METPNRRLIGTIVAGAVALGVTTIGGLPAEAAPPAGRCNGKILRTQEIDNPAGEELQLALGGANIIGVAELDQWTPADRKIVLRVDFEGPTCSALTYTQRFTSDSAPIVDLVDPPPAVPGDGSTSLVFEATTPEGYAGTCIGVQTIVTNAQGTVLDETPLTLTSDECGPPATRYR